MLAVRNHPNHFADKEFECARACCSETVYGTHCIITDRAEQRVRRCRFFRVWMEEVHPPGMPSLMSSDSDASGGDEESSSDCDSDAGPTMPQWITLDPVCQHVNRQLLRGVRPPAPVDPGRSRGKPARTSHMETHGGDIITYEGFHTAMRLALRLAPGGLLFAAPDCSSFCWLAPSVMCRTRANHGNLIALATAFLLAVAWCRGVIVAMENPPRSSIFNFLRSCSMLPFVRSSVVRDRCLDDESKNPLQKDYKIVASEDWAGLAGRCKCPPNTCHVKLTRVRQTEGKTKRTRKTGPMKASASYLRIFGIWLSQCGCMGQLGRQTPPPRTN